jgi:hypothetical protein
LSTLPSGITLLRFPVFVSAPMFRSAAVIAKGYQVGFDVVAQLTSPLYVMDLEISHPSARLATPAVTLEDLLTELAISFWSKPQARPFGLYSIQGTTWTASSTSILCGLGRASTIRVRAAIRALWFPVSRLTPARKSAQIISRQ